MKKGATLNWTECKPPWSLCASKYANVRRCLVGMDLARKRVHWAKVLKGSTELQSRRAEQTHCSGGRRADWCRTSSPPQHCAGSGAAAPQSPSTAPSAEGLGLPLLRSCKDEGTPHARWPLQMHSYSSQSYITWYVLLLKYNYVMLIKYSKFNYQNPTE